MDGHLPRRQQAKGAIDITWISCRDVRSTVPFRAPSLYASVRISLSSSADKNQAAGSRHSHRVTTAADGDGGENPEWDAPLRLYLPDRVAGGVQESEDALLVTFEIREELPILGDVLAASAAVPVADLAAAGSSGQSSYQLTAPDGKSPNGVVSFSYALIQGDLATSPGPSTVEATAASRPYQGIHWPSTEQADVYPPLAVTAEAPSVMMYPPPLQEATCCFMTAEQVAVYPPLPGAACDVYPFNGAPPNYFPPPPPSASPGRAWTVPQWGHRC